MYMGESIVQRRGTFHTEDLTVWGSLSLFVASSIRPSPSRGGEICTRDYEFSTVCQCVCTEYKTIVKSGANLCLGTNRD